MEYVVFLTIGLLAFIPLGFALEAIQRRVKRRHDPVDSFIDFVKREAVKAEVEVYFEDGPSVMLGEMACNGYFDSENRILAVAVGKPFEQWFPVFVHEYCHMTQWLDEVEAWTDVDDSVYTIFDAWLTGRVELNYQQKEAIVIPIMKLEHDNERRTLETIKKFNLPIDLEEYAQNANAYVLFHHVVAARRQWYVVGREPYNLPHIRAAMPKALVTSCESVPQNLYEVLETALE